MCHYKIVGLKSKGDSNLYPENLLNKNCCSAAVNFPADPFPRSLDRKFETWWNRIPLKLAQEISSSFMIVPLASHWARYQSLWSKELFSQNKIVRIHLQKIHLTFGQVENGSHMFAAAFSVRPSATFTFYRSLAHQRRLSRVSERKTISNGWVLLSRVLTK